MKIFPLIIGAIFLIFAGLVPVNAQSAPDVSATIQFNNGQTVTIDDFSDQIGVQPGETVTVTIQFDSSHAGESIDVGSLDGGWISNASTLISDEGQATFSFQSTATPGGERVVVHYGLRTLRIQFWALSSNPEDNPPVVTPAHPNI